MGEVGRLAGVLLVSMAKSALAWEITGYHTN
jgi:hypothetical protein